MAAKQLDPEFKQHLMEALEEVSPTEIGEITADTELSDLGLDSISLAELVIVLEEKVDVTIEPEELEALVTFGDLQGMVQKLRAS